MLGVLGRGRAEVATGERRTVHAHDRPRHFETVPGAHHCRDRLLPFLRVRQLTNGVGAEAPLLRKPERRTDRFFIGKLARGFAVALLDARRAHRLDHALLAIAAAGQAARFAEGVASVIDITELGKALDDRLRIGAPRTVPPALAQLPSEIGAELRARRREPLDIA